MNLLSRIARKVKSALHDLRHGGYTGGVHPTRYAHLGATHTVSTKHALIPLLLGPFLRPGDVFVDVGCGRGRVLNWVADDGRAAAIFGLELDKRFAAEVALRFKANDKVTIVAGDALSSLPDSATLFYLWNPFNEKVMERFKERLIEKYRRLGSLVSLRVIYHHCLFASVWRNDPRCRVSRISLPESELDEAILVTFDEAAAS
ncbi:MAG: class I SAM-dependent methyltransferase [Caldimonas sp.]